MGIGRSLVGMAAVSAAAVSFSAWSSLAQPTPQPQPQLKQFTLFVHETPTSYAKRTSSIDAESYWSSFAAYTKTLADAGVLVGGNAVESPASGTTVQVRGGKAQIASGSVKDGATFISGYFIIQAPDIAAAAEWASKCPAAADASIDVRPNVPNPQMNAK